MASSDFSQTTNPRHRRFGTTHWSLILRAGDKGANGSAEALATLCETYWYPLYAFARRRGFDVDDAQDLTQGFFSRLLEKDFISRANPERGRFRAFLVTAFKYFLANQHDSATARKRGGGVRLASLEEAESQYQREPGHHLTPEMLYDQQWARTLLAQTFRQLEREADHSRRRPQFELLRPLLTGDETPYKTVAVQLGMSPGAVRVAVHRWRRRFAQVLRAQIAETVESPEEVEDELRHLLAASGHTGTRL